MKVAGIAVVVVSWVLGLLKIRKLVREVRAK